MRSESGKVMAGIAGIATEVLTTWEEGDSPDKQGTVAVWLLECPGQSPAWNYYLLSIIHLRPIEGVRPAYIRIPGATHEVLLLAVKGEAKPDDHNTWKILSPSNVEEQIQLPDDEAAKTLLEQCAAAVVTGQLPAEPMLAGQVEPWRTVLIKTAAHHRGEEHAP